MNPAKSDLCKFAGHFSDFQSDRVLHNNEKKFFFGSGDVIGRRDHESEENSFVCTFGGRYVMGESGGN